VIADRLPDRTRRFLAGQAAKGERNSEAFAAACQLRDAGLPLDEAMARIRDGARICGLPDREAAAVVRSAYSRSAREGQPVAVAGRRIFRIAPSLPPKPPFRTLRTHFFISRVKEGEGIKDIEGVQEERPKRPAGSWQQGEGIFSDA